MKKLAVVAVNMWLSYLFGSLLVMAFLGAAGPVHAAEFFCPSGDVTCLIRAINEANQNGQENTIFLERGVYNITTVDHDNFDGPTGLPSVTSTLTIRGQDELDAVIEKSKPIQLIFASFMSAQTGI